MEKVQIAYLMENDDVNASFFSRSRMFRLMLFVCMRECDNSGIGVLLRMLSSLLFRSAFSFASVSLFFR